VILSLGQSSSALPERARLTVAVIAVLYFVVVIAIGVWSLRRTRTSRDFFLAGGGIGVFTLAIAAMASTLSGFSFIGGPGLVYTLGLGALHVVLPLSVTNVLGAWVLAKRLRLLHEVRGVITVPAAIGARYRSPLAQGLSAVAILVAVVGYMATNFLALGIVIDAIFGTGLAWGIWIGTLVTVAYTAAGGILAGVYTDVFQGTIMATASALVFYFALDAGGGLGGLSRSILASDPAFLSPWGKITPLAALSFFFVFGMGAIGQPHVAHKFYMLKDPLRLKWYPVIMTVAMTVTQLLFIGVGLAVKSLVSRGEMAPLTRPDDATPAFLLQYTPTLLAALVFSGVVAAIMSTVNSFLNVGAAALTHDLPAAFRRRVGNELHWGRISTMLLSLVATVVAVESRTLVAFLGIFGWGLFASTLVPALAIGLNWRGATRQGAIASIVTGLAITLTLETLAYRRVFTFPSGVTATALALVFALLLFFVVSWLTRRSAASHLDDDIRIVMEV
jgi:Na+/proline symporter